MFLKEQLFENENGSFQQLQGQIEGVTYTKRLSKSPSYHKLYHCYCQKPAV